ncbi:polysaccharide biosynthesis family protein [Clostridium baratii str. Sullivan]|uniref:Polysaccharide biosynthesis family protein n=1 Tax=Clostridium baratii str. Sullivan TaxID=1415775 RepID=A0A0A7FTL7_9CLOT|nr:oligosaccharide flippase family protein [Clostridium baratii]AIY82893.1 polysaccharide biosynthesis family protein [Clostridium baratii str. Sullivan]
MNKGLLKKFCEYGIGSFITLFLGFITSPIVTRLINPDEYGKYSMFMMMSNLCLFIIMFGFDQAFIRFFYDEKEEDRKKLLMKCISIPIIMWIITTFIFLSFGEIIIGYLFGSTEYNIVYIIVLNNLINIFNKFSLIMLRMEQKSKLYSLMQISQKIIYITTFIIIVFPMNKKFLSIVLSIVISNLIVTVIGMYSSRKYWIVRYKDFQDLKYIKTNNKEILKYGIPLVFTFAVTWLFQSMDKLSIKQWSNYTELGIYGAAFTIISLLTTVQHTFSTFWLPVSFEKIKQNNKKEDVKKFFIKIYNLISVIMIFIGLNLIIFKDLIIYILGNRFREASYLIPFLILMPIMYTISEVTVIGINYTKKTKYHIFIALICLIINFIGNYILVPQIGAKGAAISTGTTYIIFFIARTVISSKLLEFSFSIKRILIIIVFMGILAIYSTFNKLDFFMISLYIITLIVLIKLYKYEVGIIINYIKKEFIRLGKNIVRKYIEKYY